MLINGIPFLDVLEICGDKFKKNKNLSVAIKQIKNEIIGGSEIFDAFAQHSNLFNKAVISEYKKEDLQSIDWYFIFKNIKILYVINF